MSLSTEMIVALDKELARDTKREDPTVTHSPREPHTPHHRITPPIKLNAVPSNTFSHATLPAKSQENSNNSNGGVQVMQPVVNAHIMADHQTHHQKSLTESFQPWNATLPTTMCLPTKGSATHDMKESWDTFQDSTDNISLSRVPHASYPLLTHPLKLNDTLQRAQDALNPTDAPNPQGTEINNPTTIPPIPLHNTSGKSEIISANSTKGAHSFKSKMKTTKRASQKIHHEPELADPDTRNKVCSPDFDSYPSTPIFPLHGTSKILNFSESNPNSLFSLIPPYLVLIISLRHPPGSAQVPLATAHDLKLRKVVQISQQGRKKSGSTAEFLIDVPIQIATPHSFLAGLKRHQEEYEVSSSAGAGKLPRRSQ